MTITRAFVHKQLLQKLAAVPMMFLLAQQVRLKVAALLSARIPSSIMAVYSLPRMMCKAVCKQPNTT